MRKKISCIAIFSLIVPMIFLFQNFSTYFNLANADVKILADPSVFNCDFYSSYNADIKSAFQNDCNAMTKHWIDNGIAEGRRGHENFYVVGYKNMYKTNEPIFGTMSNVDAIKHYVFQGRVNENRAGDQITQGLTNITFTQNISIEPLGFNNSGGAIASCQIVPSLPAGLTLNTSTCVFSGAPLAVQGQIQYTVTAVNGAGSSASAFNISVRARPRYKVGAYYFGMFAPYSHYTNGVFFASNIHDNVYVRKSGQPSLVGDYWAGVRDLYLGNEFTQDFKNMFTIYNGYDGNIFNTWRVSPKWSVLQPAIGYYNQAEISTVEKHIQQATENGIDYFSFYWYWNKNIQGPDLNFGLDNFLKSRNNKKMDFMLSLCQHGWTFSIPYSQWDLAIDKIVGYFQTDNYLKISGRPAIQICDVGSSDPVRGGLYMDGHTPDEFITKLKAKTLEKMNAHPFTTFRSDDTALKNKINLGNIDAAQCLLTAYQLTTTPGAVVDYNYIANHVAAANIELANGKPIMPCLGHNFDERPRMGVLENKEHYFQYKYQPDTIAETYSDELFRVNLVNIKNWMDSRPSDEVASKYLTIYAWNEWHEGGIIEPNSKDGAKKLNMINDVFSLKKGFRKCQTTGLCAGDDRAIQSQKYIQPQSAITAPPPVVVAPVPVVVNPPVVVDTPAAVAPVLPPAEIQIYRKRSGSDYLATPDESEGAAYGYATESVFRFFANADSGTRAIYRCSGSGGHFVSTMSNCEGQSVEGILAYLSISNNSAGTLRPIYRIRTSAGNKLISYYENEGQAYGCVSEGLIGYGP